ncbi:MAG: ATP-binding protein [Firmicutes bacterium]|nr:ATP-binding protein [Candidatus Colimorpha enterica]
MEEKAIPKRILSSLVASLSAGVVPRLGAPYIAIGRDNEVKALLSDLNELSEGGASMRFIIGRYGSGKSFLMQLMRGYALERGYVTCDCDLSPERRLCGTSGSGIATYRELVKNMAIKTSPDGGALPIIISKWLSSIQSTVAASGISPDSREFAEKVSASVYANLKGLQSCVGGFDFSYVLSEYFKASLSGDEFRQSCCIKWLRGEYTTKTDAKQELKVSSIINDDNWYDYIKLWTEFTRNTGYKGFVLFIDECVNLYKISNRIGRENNYEKILSMFNDTLQGRAPGLAIIFGGTGEFLEDKRRGLFSYEALRSRLADSKYVSDGKYTDLMGPVIRLRPLSANELLALISRITKLHSMCYGIEERVSDENMVDFLKSATDRVGSDSMLTPREIIRDYLSVLSILMQNPDVTFEMAIGKAEAEKPKEEKDIFDLNDIEI